MKLTIWVNKLFVETSASSVNYGTYAKWVYEYALAIISDKQKTGLSKKAIIPARMMRYEANLKA